MENIPSDKPVIIAANHPTGFMEPCVMAVFMRRPLYFLVRGDFFRKPFFNWAMRSLNLLPIYRREDTDFRGLTNNHATFKACYDALKEHKTIFIFPEGRTRHEKWLRPIQKGIARLSLDTLEEHPDMEDIYIVPVAVNYTYAAEAREKLLIEALPPLSVRRLQQVSGGNRAKAVNAIKKQLFAALEKKVVIVARGKEELTEYLHVLSRSPFPEPVFPVLNNDREALQREKMVADRVPVLEEKIQEELLLECRAYFMKLMEERLSDRTVFQKGQMSYLSLLWLVLGFLPAMVGRVFTFIPFEIARWIKVSKVKRPEFYAPVLLAANMGTFIIFYVLWFLIALFTTHFYLFPLALVLGSLSYIFLIWKEKLDQWFEKQRFRRMDEGAKKELLQKRKKIIKKMELLEFF